MEQTRNEGNGFFDVITDKQTYLSMIYLILTFPQGIFYFAYIAAGFSVGLGLIPVFIGIPILYVFMISIKYLMKFERKMAALFLGVDIKESSSKREKGVGILLRFRDELFDIELWKAVAYITLKFFLGVMIFALCAALVSLSLGLIAAPIIYGLMEYNLAADGGLQFDINGVHIIGLLGFLGISATPEQEVLILMILGIFIGIASLHLFNKAAYFMGALLRAMSPGN